MYCIYKHIHQSVYKHPFLIRIDNMFFSKDSQTFVSSHNQVICLHLLKQTPSFLTQTLVWTLLPHCKPSIKFAIFSLQTIKMMMDWIKLKVLSGLSRSLGSSNSLFQKKIKSWDLFRTQNIYNMNISTMGPKCGLNWAEFNFPPNFSSSREYYLGTSCNYGRQMENGKCLDLI